uniref:DUF4371 domain-containing protein n=1 Tax=Maylandia zebra TaxID=106582 RepID=A0A3P9DHS7_9CICH
MTRRSQMAAGQAPRALQLIVKRHFETKHQKTFTDEAEKVESITCTVSRYEKQASTLQVFTAAKHHGTQVSFRIAHCIAKHGKPFTDGEFVKEAFLSNIPASARTVERRIQEMGDNVRAQQTAGLKEAQVFSVALDESVDINGVPRLAVMVRYCDVAVQEELFCLTPMPETTRGEDVANVFKECFDEQGIDITKISDGAPAMVGKHRGAVTMKLHCMIHQENLCAKMSNSDLHDVMATVAKVVNFIVKQSPFTHRQFQSLLEEMDSSCKDIPLHCAVRWLCCGKVLERFVDCFDVVKKFLAEKGQSQPELEDEKWVEKLFFLADITGHLNELILKLQGSGQTVLDMRDTWEAFIQKLAVFSSDIETSTFRYFKRLRELSAQRSISTTEIHRAQDTPLRCIFTCWTSLPDKFNCLKNIAQALLTVFGSTYLCEQIFSHMKSVLSASRCRLTAGHSETCVLLKVTKCDPQITQLANTKQGQGSH